MPRFYAAHFLFQMVFLQGVLVHFFAARGFSISEIFLFKNMVFVASMALQIPTGFLADRFGRKPIMVLGAATKALGCLVIAMSADLLALVIAYLMIGAGLSFYQAGEVAYVYERTAAADPVKARRSIARLTVVATFAVFVSTIVGGILSTHSLDLVAWVNFGAAFVAIGLLAACDLDGTKPGGRRGSADFAEGPGKSAAQSAPSALPAAIFALLAGALFYVPSLLAITTFQALWNETGVSALVAAQLTAVVGLAGAMIAYVLAGTPLAGGPWRFLLGGTICLVGALSIGGLASVAAAVLAAILFECLKAYAIVGGRVLLNESIGDRHRGTWNSCFLWTGQAGVVVGGPIWGMRYESDGQKALPDAAPAAILAAVAIGAFLVAGRLAARRRFKPASRDN